MSAAKELSDISNQTETRHLRHSCKTTRKQDYYFISFLVDYTLLGFDLLLGDCIPFGLHCFASI